MIHPNKIFTGSVFPKASTTFSTSQSLTQASPSRSTKSGQFTQKWRSLQAVLLRFFRRTKGFIELKHLPRLATRICRTYLNDDASDLQERCQTILQMRLDLNPHQLKQFLCTPMGKAILTRIEPFFRGSNLTQSSSSSTPSHSHDSTNKSSTLPHWHHDWHHTLLNMATDPQGISLLSFLRHAPKSLTLNADQVLLTAHQIAQLLEEHQQVVTEIEAIAAHQAQHNPTVDFSRYPDLQQKGPFTVTRDILLVEQTTHSGLQREQSYGKPGRSRGPSQHRSCDRPTAPDPFFTHLMQERKTRTLRTLIYLPHPWPTGNVPVIIGSHGLASAPENLEDYAYHLASYGYAIALPEHPSSNVTQIHHMLNGTRKEVVPANEFIHRPLDISAVLDALEARNQTHYHHQLNLNRVGVMGLSFGAYTALVLAGAEIQWDTLAAACTSLQPQPNLSLLLQCRALPLSQSYTPSYSMQDYRVGAVLILDSVGSKILGPAGISHIMLPVMMIAGSDDTTAPLTLEQFRLFQWLNTGNRYFGLIKGKSHIRNWNKLITSLQLQIQFVPPLDIPEFSVSTPYIKALSVAFFNTHVAQHPQSSVYLHANYGTFLSQPPYPLSLLDRPPSNMFSDY